MNQLNNYDIHLLLDNPATTIDRPDPSTTESTSWENNRQSLEASSIAAAGSKPAAATTFLLYSQERCRSFASKFGCSIDAKMDNLMSTFDRLDLRTFFLDFSFSCNLNLA